MSERVTVSYESLHFNCNIILCSRWSEVSSNFSRKRRLWHLWHLGCFGLKLCQGSFFHTVSILPCLFLRMEFPSSLNSLWPVYIVVNNLPPSIRMYSENVILCALWCGPGKPPVYQSSNEDDLTTIGITMHTLPVVWRPEAPFWCFRFACKSYCPERQAIQRCSTCLHPGVRLSNGVYLRIEQRTNLSVIRDANKAEENGCPENGVKGVSVLTHMIDLVNGIPWGYKMASTCLDRIFKFSWTILHWPICHCNWRCSAEPAPSPWI